MKKYLVHICIFILSLTPVVGNANSEWITHTEGKFQVTYPEGWGINTAEDGYIFQIGSKGLQDDSIFTTINVIKDRENYEVYKGNLKSYIKDSLSGLSDDGYIFSGLKKKKGKEYYILTHTKMMDGIEFKIHQHIFFQDESIILITVGYFTQDENEVTSTITKILKNIIIK